MQKSEDNTIYALQDASRVTSETARLDGLHKAITQYFGGLSLAPLQDAKPETILEVGSGSGAWAIQAAEEYPKSSVLAIDVNPLPFRQIPPNLIFQKVDLTQDLPFEEKKFDVIHARLVIMHLPNGEEVLNRLFKLLKPGGWIIVEEPDDEMMKDGGKPLGPGMTLFTQNWFKLLRSRGAEPCIGKDLEKILKTSGLFNQVHVKKVTVAISGNSTDPASNKLGLTWKATMTHIANHLPARLIDQGFTQESARNHLEELEDPQRSITTDMYFTWAQRV